MSPQQQSLENNVDQNESMEFDDVFVELPVRFRSKSELQDEDTEISTRTLQERDLRHAEELKRHAEELESLYKLLDESNQRHNEEIDSLHDSFRDERQKREDLLERALGYAEQLEASSLAKSKEQGKEVERLQMELQQRDASIETLQAQNIRKNRDILILKRLMLLMLLVSLYTTKHFLFDSIGFSLVNQLA